MRLTKQIKQDIVHSYVKKIDIDYLHSLADKYDEYVLHLYEMYYKPVLDSLLAVENLNITTADTSKFLLKNPSKDHKKDSSISLQSTFDEFHSYGRGLFSIEHLCKASLEKEPHIYNCNKGRKLIFVTISNGSSHGELLCPVADVPKEKRKKLKSIRDKLKTEIDSLHSTIFQAGCIIYGAGSDKSLIKAWPEIESLVPKEQTSNLPAVVPDALNKLANLP